MNIVGLIISAIMPLAAVSDCEQREPGTFFVKAFKDTTLPSDNEYSVFLCKNVHGQTRKVIDLKINSYQRRLNAKLTICDDRAVVIVDIGVLRLHRLIYLRKGSEKLLPYYGFGEGSADVVVVQNCIYGVFRRMDEDNLIDENILYAFDVSGLKTGLLPGKQSECTYQIRRYSRNAFFLDREVFSAKEPARIRVNVPIFLKNGVWQLSGLK